ncbi:non-canonical purine NTP pyrophosphatase, rdgB/HAM1 family [Thermovirga lienii DSM 17291]|uniref:dITP/XTP pyrophosphatase n=1 Tax=Thermovirga lienii (strain ATCC BAA-1197 / DSM 17291 / Cas60314) TaxID=580340 RepID=G7V7K1_THELD|nr:RdgB/HAM1 family non-canonical purine NTP pyrophosphatase [Thermovirga lienii]AER66163.1 non-canonical purine NTP pyrophosphatase, rdgB/HAM1 family [Thermovirga lienii DSM 17291]MDN5318924.1 XTP/dITP diphosphohydrolase [Thermovirga sp.]MDN5368017.1 XTP/dITP diphosphohydrolase [Thermovirga sp.]
MNLVPEIVFASGNEHKYLELKSKLAEVGIKLLFGPDVLGESLHVVEDGSTYLQNSYKKALAWADRTGLPAIADDSGLEVKCLGWRPGIYSSRVAENDQERIQWLLSEMQGVEDRTARFAAALALALPGGGQCWLAEGFCWGRITLEPKGSFGFGYDPVFVPEGFDKTFAELGPDVKLRVSHRSIAVKGLSDMLNGSYMVKSLLASSRQYGEVRGS